MGPTSAAAWSRSVPCLGSWISSKLAEVILRCARPPSSERASTAAASGSSGHSGWRAAAASCWLLNRGLNDSASEVCSRRTTRAHCRHASSRLALRMRQGGGGVGEGLRRGLGWAGGLDRKLPTVLWGRRSAR